MQHAMYVQSGAQDIDFVKSTIKYIKFQSILNIQLYIYLRTVCLLCL